MPLMTMGKCFRDRNDCESFDVVEATPSDLTEEQMQTLDYKPDSFVCCGCIKRKARQVPQDAYRVCFKNRFGDEMSDNDEQDLTHLLKVITTALAVLATRRVGRGLIDVPASLDIPDMLSVKTKRD